MKKRSQVDRIRQDSTGFPKAAQTAPPGGSGRPDRVLNAFWSRGYVNLVARDSAAPSGVRIRRYAAEQSCFVRLDDVDQKLLRRLKGDPDVTGISFEKEWVRLKWRDRDACLHRCREFHDRGIPTHEGGLGPVLRYLVDHDIQVARPRIAWLDIETDSRVPFSKKEEMRILCWALVDEEGRTDHAVLKADSDSREKELLEQLWSALDRYDLVAAWNGDRFDFPVVFARSERRRIRGVDWRRWLWLDHLELFRRMNTMAAESGDEKQSFALGAISQVLLGEGKDDLDASKTWDYWASGGEARNRLVRYCIKDTELMPKLEVKTGYIELLLTLGEVCGTFADSRGMMPSVQVESFLQRLAHKRGYKFPTVIRRRRNGEKYKGAFVMEPAEKGIVKNVHVADFASLYPSIIKTWNMSPETKVAEDRGGSISPLTGVHFDTTSPGILPVAVGEMMRLRQEWKEKKAAAVPGTEDWKAADRKSTAYKIAANSFYGVVGAPMSRFFDRQVAESVSQCGVWLIQRTIREAEQRGMRVVYGDTDSVLVAGTTRLEFEDFVKWCNAELYPRILREVGCKENNIVLDYEKEFERIVFTRAKRYVGRYAHYKGTAADENSKPEVKGLEYKRGDSIRLARQLQEQAVDMLVGPRNGGVEDPNEFEELLDKWLRRILLEPLALEDVVISKRLNKPLNDYVRKTKKDGTFARQLPHIEIARELEARGRDVGEGAKIDYVITEGTRPLTVIPAEDWSGDVDRHVTWESLVAPPTLRLLIAAFPGHDWSRWEIAR